MYNINDRVISVLNNGEHPNREFIETYLALKIKLGYYTILEGQEGFVDILAKFAGFALKSFGRGLFTVARATFNTITLKSEKTVKSYKKTLEIWKDRVWVNARSVDGVKFDDYVIKIVPYKVLKDRINAVLAIHKALENVEAIMNAPVASDNYWLTNECQKAIDYMSKIGFNAKNYNMLTDELSNSYKNAEIKQPIFLHKYTLNNIMGLLNHVDKIVNYASPKYIREYQEKFEDCTYDLDEKEGDILLKEGDDDSVKNDKIVAKDKYELAMRSSRMWWIIHFIKAAYFVTNDIFKDIEKLVIVSEKCIV